MKCLIKLAAAAALAIGLAVPAQADNRPDLVVAVNGLPPSLESIEEMGNVAVRITYSMFDSLIRRDFLADDTGAASKLVPGLAESWKRIDDRTVELKLRKGVKFHNGDEVTSDDVVFSLSPGRGHGYNPLIPAAHAFMGTISYVEPIDRYTVRIVAKAPDVMFEQRLAGYAMWIVNAREYLLKGKEAFARNPVGTGPYKMDKWIDGEYVRLVAHDDYFGSRPTAKSITFKVVPEVAARIAGLVSGEYDIIVNVPPDQVPVLRKYKDIKVEQVVLDNSHMLVFFVNGVLKDKRIRQALSLAIDRALLRETLWENKNYTPNGHQLPSYVMHIKDYPAFAYDPDKARALVKEAGYKGEPIVYKLPLNYYLLSLEAAQAMQQMWKDVGLNVKLEPVENWAQVTDPKGRVDIRPWSNTHRLPDPVGSFVPQWGPKSEAQVNKQDPARAWKAPARFNDLMKVIVTSTSMDERQKAYRETLDIWADEAPGTMLYNPLETYAIKASVQWRPVSLYYMDFRPDNLKFAKVTN